MEHTPEFGCLEKGKFRDSTLETFCDFTLIEQSTVGEKRPYPVHRIILYSFCPYFKALFSSSTGDAKLQSHTIRTESETLGILGIAIDIIYNISFADGLIKKMLPILLFPDVMNLYLLCDYLCLSTPLVFLQNEIKGSVEGHIVLKWWNEKMIANCQVPKVVEQLALSYLSTATKMIGEEKYISLKALSALVTDEQPFLTEVSRLLTNAPKSGTLPNLSPYSMGKWIDPKTKYIFSKDETTGGFYITGHFNTGAQLVKHLTAEDRKIIENRGWKC